MDSKTTVSQDGTQVRHQVAGATQQEKPSPNTGVRVLVAESTRMSVGADGQVTSLGPTFSTQAPTPTTDPFATAKHPVYGSPVSRDKIGPDTILTIGGRSDKASAFETMGIIARDEQGRYTMAEKGRQAEKGHQAEKGNGEQTPAREYQPVSLGDDGEKHLAEAVSTVGETRFLATAEAIVRGGNVDAHIQDISSRTGQEPEKVRAEVERVTARFIEAGARVTGLAPADYDTFTSWAQQEHGDAFTEACRSFVMKADPRGLQALSQQYARTGAVHSNADLLAAQVPEGVRVYEQQGEVMIAIPGHGNVRLKDAVRQGIVTVRGQ